MGVFFGTCMMVSITDYHDTKAEMTEASALIFRLRVRIPGGVVVICTMDSWRYEC